MAAPYSDIFNYILGTAPVDQITAFSEGKMTVDPKYQNIVNILNRQSGGDDPRESQVIDIDYAKLPNHGMTKYGLVGSGAIPAGDPSIPIAPGVQSTLKDPKLVYNDPNYGWVTPGSNRKVSTGEKINDYMPYIMMALATAGFGALAAIPAGVLGAASAGAKAIGKAEGSGNVYGRSALTGNPGNAGIGNVATPSATAPGLGLSGLSTPQRATAPRGGLSQQKAMQLLRMIRGG